MKGLRDGYAAIGKQAFQIRVIRYHLVMSTVQEIEASIPQLTRAELEKLRERIDDYLEDRLELTDEVKAKLEQSRREIEAGQFTTRRPESVITLWRPRFRFG